LGGSGAEALDMAAIICCRLPSGKAVGGRKEIAFEADCVCVEIQSNL